MIRNVRDRVMVEWIDLVSLPTVAALLVGFVSGYALRELMSRRRHTAIRKRYYKKHTEFRGSVGES
jgi:hypothetical protein